MAAKFVVIVFVLALVACSLAAPRPDPKAQFLAAAPVTYSVGGYPYTYSSYSSYVSPYSSVVSPYSALAYPSLAYSYNYPYALL